MLQDGRDGLVMYLVNWNPTIWSRASTIYKIILITSIINLMDRAGARTYYYYCVRLSDICIGPHLSRVRQHQCSG
jgi:hypothetical protein